MEVTSVVDAGLVGTIEGAVSMRMVRVEVAVRPDWSVATRPMVSVAAAEFVVAPVGKGLCSGQFLRERDRDPSVRHYLSELWNREDGNDADRCVPDFLCVYRLRGEAAAEAGRLLRFLFLRLGALSAGSGWGYADDGVPMCG